mmetsp:Transcript_35685/g.90949  ORF Transcript_35685/g.90949 Transcript_35685/m.90949 type:complete len:230 (+) Transcript_35685:1913-2602(+)
MTICGLPKSSSSRTLAMLVLGRSAACSFVRNRNLHVVVESPIGMSTSRTMSCIVDTFNLFNWLTRSALSLVAVEAMDCSLVFVSPISFVPVDSFACVVAWAAVEGKLSVGTAVFDSALFGDQPLIIELPKLRSAFVAAPGDHEPRSGIPAKIEAPVAPSKPFTDRAVGLFIRFQNASPSCPTVPGMGSPAKRESNCACVCGKSYEGNASWARVVTSVAMGTPAWNRSDD